MTPAEIRALRSQANLVQDYLNQAIQMDTELRRQEFERVEAHFKDRYPGYEWRTWQTINSEREAQR